MLHTQCKLKETFAVWEFHWKSSAFLKFIFWPRNGNIDQFWGLNMKVHHSRFPKSNFIFMIHHYDVINRPIYKGFSKMNLTHHSLYFHSIRFSISNSSTTGKIQGVWIVFIHRILSEVRKFPWSQKSLFDTPLHQIWWQNFTDTPRWLHSSCLSCLNIFWSCLL